MKTTHFHALSLFTTLLIGSTAALTAQTAAAQASSATRNLAESKFSSDYEELIPRNLLSLMHSEEVQQELQFDVAGIRRLEAFFGKIDSAWFQARNLKPAENLKMLAQLEQQMRGWISKNTSVTQRNRLKQIEYRSQAVRILLRDDVAKQIDITTQQRNQLADLAKATEAAKRDFNKAAYTSAGATAEQQQAVADTMKKENDSVKSIMRQEQMQQLSSILGKPFDTASMKRIYPMAPELADAEDWINSGPIKLKDLRGKVVLVHFYAFQCHNCHANFDIYKKWHKELKSKGVEVIGIQTPETRREEDPNAVRSAAADRDLDFPILVDLKKDNWKNWGNTMWPTVYVIDQRGYIRHWQMGELQWKGARYDKDVERVIDGLLQESS